jgi:cytoskeletal protein RodZ
MKHEKEKEKEKRKQKIRKRKEKKKKKHTVHTYLLLCSLILVVWKAYLWGKHGFLYKHLGRGSTQQPRAAAPAPHATSAAPVPSAPRGKPLAGRIIGGVFGSECSEPKIPAAQPSVALI